MPSPDERYLPGQRLSWEPVALKPGTVKAARGTDETLAPAGEVVPMTADLRDFADFNRPGSYRVKFTFQKQNGASAEQSAEVVFAIYEY